MRQGARCAIALEDIYGRPISAASARAAHTSSHPPSPNEQRLVETRSAEGRRDHGLPREPVWYRTSGLLDAEWSFTGLGVEGSRAPAGTAATRRHVHVIRGG